MVSRMTQLRYMCVPECEHITSDGVEAAEAAIQAPDRENNDLNLNCG